MASDTVDTSGVTSYAATSETRAFSVDGWTQGTLKSLSFDADGKITLATGVEGSHAWISVEDTGCGISEENVSRIFDPFFTTKPVGQGTGLGLEISMKLVRHNGGTLEVESRPGRTEFRVTVPAM